MAQLGDTIVRGDLTVLGDTKVEGGISVNEKGVIMSNQMSSYTMGTSTFKYYDVTFKNKYNNPPIVMTTYINNETGGSGGIIVGVSNITTIGCRLIMYWNANSADLGVEYVVYNND